MLDKATGILKLIIAETTLSEFRKAFDNLKKVQKALVIDLRDTEVAIWRKLLLLQMNFK
jgi:hypothetical protein